jgi:hypothetical protein
MYNGIPDVLMDDVFLEVARLPDEPELVPDLVMKLEVPLGENKSKSFSDEIINEPPKTLGQLIDSLPERVKYFALTCYPSTSSSIGSFTCDACGIYLKKSSTFVRCAECLSPMVDLCTHCFSNGAEFGSHLRNHGYIVVSGRSSQLLRQSRSVGKLDIRSLMKFMQLAERKGSLNFAELEKTLNIEGDGERLYLELVSMLTSCDEQSISQHALEDGPSDVDSSLGGGPANFNVLRDEFEHDYVPEAETLLAAVNIGTNGPLPEVLHSLFEGYNGILDERERRRKILKASNLVNLKEYYNVLKKRKTDEKEMFEKLRMFVRPVLHATDNGTSCMAWLETLALTLTSRKRLVDRIKRLCTLKKHGIQAEVTEASQFDTDRKKRGDINMRKTPGMKIWANVPAVSSTEPRAERLSSEQALLKLPGGELLKRSQTIQLCIDLQLSPQHFLVIESGIHAVLRTRRDSFIDDETLKSLVQDGVFGTVRRYLLASQGLPVSASALALPAPIDEMKAQIVQHCRRSFTEPSR